MTTMSAKEAKERFGVLVDTAQREPVTITKHDRPSVVVISAQRYAELEAAEERCLIEQACAGRESGYLGVEASEKLLNDILNAEA